MKVSQIIEDTITLPTLFYSSENVFQGIGIGTIVMS